MNARPDFGKFEITSIKARKRWSNAFLFLCAVTSTFSIVILVVLISTIVISAMPVFGPHSDRLESSSRIIFSQASARSERDSLGEGDLVQGIFRPEKLVRGGLGKVNDQSLWSEQEPTETGVKIGFYAFEISGASKEIIRTMGNAKGPQSIESLLERLGVPMPEEAANAGLVVLESATGQVNFAEIETDGPLVNEKLIKQFSSVNDWTVTLLAGVVSANDFAEIRFQKSNLGELSKIRKTRTRKRAGQMKLQMSILAEAGHENGHYADMKLRRYTDDQITKSQLKVDSAELKGISRRKRKGFDLGGSFDVEWRSQPESHASTLEHVAHFLTAKPNSSDPATAGIGPALWGSVWVCTFCALFALPLGIGTAIFLEEFKPTNRFLLFLQNLVQLNITNLAGVPSIVYGILGLTAFATMFGVFGSDKEPIFRFGGEYYYQYLSEGMSPFLVPVSDPSTPPELIPGIRAEDGDHQPITLNVIGPSDPLPDDETLLQWTVRSDSEGGMHPEKPWYYFQVPFGRGVLAASLTLMLVILPVIIIASQEAIKAVPSSLREGAMGLGSTRWQVVRNVTLPAAIPGIMTGAILSVSRAIGEAAPLVVLCGVVYIARAPEHLMDFISVLPIQIFYLTGQPISEEGQVNFQNVAAAASLVLLVVLLS
ncbi:MAG: ABC transporter permease subunit, partial [Pirellulaceae bacterium]|nr:ABC transporter permease subunit [Pirellulaceae bacterium]